MSAVVHTFRFVGHSPQVLSSVGNLRDDMFGAASVNVDVPITCDDDVASPDYVLLDELRGAMYMIGMEWVSTVPA